jgi:hypothetical protein
VIDHQHEATSFGLVDQRERLLGCRRHRLFDQHVFAGAQGCHRQLEM